MSNFSFSNRFRSSILKFSTIFIKFDIVTYKLFQFVGLKFAFVCVCGGGGGGGKEEEGMINSFLSKKSFQQMTWHVSSTEK